MRMDQYIGLNDWASNMLESYKVKCVVAHVAHPEGSDDDPNPKSFDLPSTEEMVPLYDVEIIGKIEGAWDNYVANLHRYTMPDGTVYNEYVQAEPWSSGPCYFIALKNADGNIVHNSLWTDDEINNA